VLFASVISVRIQTLALLVATGLTISDHVSFAAAPASVESRLAAQNAIFEEQYQDDLKRNPVMATGFGDYRTTTNWTTIHSRLRRASTLRTRHFSRA
jgi:hypothetical protein